VHRFPFLNAAPHGHLEPNDHQSHHEANENHHGDHGNIFGDLFSEFQTLPIKAV